MLWRSGKWCGVVKAKVFLDVHIKTGGTSAPKQIQQRLCGGRQDRHVSILLEHAEKLYLLYSTTVILFQIYMHRFKRENPRYFYVPTKRNQTHHTNCQMK